MLAAALTALLAAQHLSRRRADFSLPLAFALFATLKIPLLHRYLPPTLRDAAERWRHRQLADGGVVPVAS
ncbi:hypothetical protein [Sodalis sp.]|uniref:hypothetical protein n=1 Tax=Sodalis sp. (in: enterobacteria) TaxID=1898979 RepID=UPI003872CDA5